MLPVAQIILRNLFDLIPLAEGSPTATPVVTTTEGVTTTAGLTPTPVATVTAAPVPTPTPAPSPWSPGQWFRQTGWSNDFHSVFLILFLGIAIAAVVAYFYFSQRRFKNHTLKAHLAERLSYVLTGFAGVGFLLLLCAGARVPLLGLPIWLILTVIAFIAFVFYAVYYYVGIYPLELAKYQREQERLKYIPRGRTKGPAYTPPLKKRQQQRKTNQQTKQKPK